MKNISGLDPNFVSFSLCDLIQLYGQDCWRLEGERSPLLLLGLFRSVKRQSCCGRQAEPPSQAAGSRLPFVTTTVCRFLPSTLSWWLTDLGGARRIKNGGIARKIAK